MSSQRSGTIDLALEDRCLFDRPQQRKQTGVAIRPVVQAVQSGSQGDEDEDGEDCGQAISPPQNSTSQRDREHDPNHAAKRRYLEVSQFAERRIDENARCRRRRQRQ